MYNPYLHKDLIVDYRDDLEAAFVHLARLALEGKAQDVALLSRRTLRHISDHRPDLAGDIRKIVAETNSVQDIARAVSGSGALPVDMDSRLELLKREDSPKIPIKPVWPNSVEHELHAV